MSDTAENIVSLVTSIVEPLVEYPDELTIKSGETDEGTLLVEIHVHEDDAGKVIGRQGRIIKAIRTLSRAAASRDDLHVEVELVD